MRYPDSFFDLLVEDRAQFERLPRKLQDAYCIRNLEAQVNNGGFHQFFFNFSGEYVPETLAALTHIGADHTRVLLERAIAIAYPTGYPPNSAKHQDHLVQNDAVVKALNPLDKSFYQYVDPLEDMVNAYLARDT